jgi:hypothetical protein
MCVGERCDQTCVRSTASSPRYFQLGESFLSDPAAAPLIAGLAATPLFAEWMVRGYLELADGVEIIAGSESAEPALHSDVRVDGRTLSWQLGGPPEIRYLLRFQVRTRQPGYRAVWASARVAPVYSRFLDWNPAIPSPRLTVLRPAVLPAP